MNAAQLRTVSVTTSYANLPQLPANEVSILNNTGADLLVRMGSESGSGEEITLKNGQSAAIPVVRLASEVQIKAASGASGVQLILS